MQDAGLGKKEGIISKVADAPKKFQQASEETAKLNVFRSWVEKSAQDAGITVENALKNNDIIKNAVNKAEEAIFSPYRISQGERSIASKYIPFYSFARQSLPFFGKTLLNEPSRVAKYQKLKTVIENQSPQDAVPQSKLPDYVQGQIRLPIKDNAGRNIYIDPQYIYPFGNFQEGGTKGQLPFGLSLDPRWQELISQTSNYDPYFGGPITKSNIPSQQVSDRLTHLRRTAAPSAINNIIDKIIPAFQGNPDYTGNVRSKGQSLIDAAGIKSRTYDSATLRSKGDQSNTAQLRSYQQEYDSIANDHSLTPAQRQAKLNELKQSYDQFIQSSR
jgi:hypothetical protein